ncbi:major facilitator superfamily domain-containing protein [Bipolaris maydis]|nr:major facilitator superfamily domain-containing protein [Bipolaris maydis]
MEGLVAILSLLPIRMPSVEAEPNTVFTTIFLATERRTAADSHHPPPNQPPPPEKLLIVFSVLAISHISLLSISSLLCGLALNATMLYAFRALSGVANGGIVSLSSMIVSDIVTLKERGKWQGMIGACVGIGNMSGPFIAAAFVQKSTWRGFFWLLSPVAAVCAVLCMFVLPTPVHQPRTDAKTLIPVAGGGDYFNWDSPMVISMMVLGGCCVLVFVYIEHRVAVLPMMPLTLFKSGPVSVMLIQNFLFGMVAYSQTYYLPLFMQNARRFSPIISACLMLPIYALQMLSSIASVIWAGFSLWTLGVGLTCVFSLDTPLWAIIIILAIQGIGIGAVFQPVLVALQAHCSKAHRAIVISNRNFIRSLGGAVGLAVSAAALQNSLQSAMPAEFRSLTLSSYDTPPFETLNDTQIRLILNGYATASRTVFIVNVPLMVLCLIGCFFIKDEGLLQQEGEDNDIEKTISRDGVSSHTGR